MHLYANFYQDVIFFLYITVFFLRISASLFRMINPKFFLFKNVLASCLYRVC